jgi:hypothetical protein
MMNTTQAANTDDLFSYFERQRSRAQADTGTLRDVAIRNAFDAEWHTLFSCLMIDAMRSLYDGARVAKRLDEMRAEMRQPSTRAGQAT